MVDPQTEDNDMIEELLARQDRIESREAIRDCLYRYCRGIDRADAAVLRSAYWPDAIDDHVLFNGNAYDFIDWCVPLLAQVEHSQHMLGNIQIELDGTSPGSKPITTLMNAGGARPVRLMRCSSCGTGAVISRIRPTWTRACSATDRSG
jgi:hypothetical protein